MTIFKENPEFRLSCGINDDGDLFLGDEVSGYNMPDTPENREFIMEDFDNYNEYFKRKGKGKW